MFGQNERSRDFQRGMNAEDRRRDRQDERLRLRKRDRMERLQKRRHMMRQGSSAGASRSAAGNLGEPSSAAACAMVASLPSIVHACFSDDTATVLKAVQSIRHLLSVERSPPIDQVVQSGVVPQLIRLLEREDCSELRSEAAWALTNIASGTPEQTAVVVRNGVVLRFVAMLNSSDVDLVDQAVWGLANIAGDSPELRDHVLEAGALPPVLQLLHQHAGSRHTVGKNAAWTLSNLCRNKPLPPPQVVSQVLPSLKDLLQCGDEDIVQDILWAMSYITDDEHAAEEVCRRGIVPVMVPYLGHQKSSIKHGALRAVGNIVAGTEQLTQVPLNAGLLDYLPALLDNSQHHSQKVKKESCWLASNLLAGNDAQIRAVFNAPGRIFHKLVRLMYDPAFMVRKEAGFALCNATSLADPTLVRAMVDEGVLPAIVKELRALDVVTQLRFAETALEAVVNILKAGEGQAQLNAGVNPYWTAFEECRGVDMLTHVLAHEMLPDEISTMATGIMQRYVEVQAEGGMPAGAPITTTTTSTTTHHETFTFGSAGQTMGSSESFVF